MEQEFHIYFSHNGTHYKASVLKKDAAAATYFRVEYKTGGLEIPPKIIFIRLNEDSPGYTNPFWEQCPGTANVLEDDFIFAMGAAIENIPEKNGSPN
jgi:hypothetical protein